MLTPREKFQQLLKKVFQLDSAELDFGIYRIMNYKRDVIERFIRRDLLGGVAKELQSGALAQDAALSKELEQMQTRVREAYGDDAFDAEGNLIKGQELQLGKEYFGLRERAEKSKSKPELEFTEGTKQRLVFIEPHGMKLETHPATNPKVNLYKKLQTQEEDARKKSKVTGLSLDAFIVSATPFDDLQPHHGPEWDRAKYAGAHIFFGDEDNHGHIEAIVANV